MEMNRYPDLTIAFLLLYFIIAMLFMRAACGNPPKYHTQQDVLEFLQNEKMNAHWQKHYEDWLKKQAKRKVKK